MVQLYKKSSSSNSAPSFSNDHTHQNHTTTLIASHNSPQGSALDGSSLRRGQLGLGSLRQDPHQGPVARCRSGAFVPRAPGPARQLEKQGGGPRRGDWQLCASTGGDGAREPPVPNGGHEGEHGPLQLRQLLQKEQVFRPPQRLEGLQDAQLIGLIIVPRPLQERNDALCCRCVLVLRV